MWSLSLYSCVFYLCCHLEEERYCTDTDHITTCSALLLDHCYLLTLTLIVILTFHYNYSLLSGGFLGGKLYALNRAYLPFFMGITMAASAILMKQLMTMDLDAVGITQLACPVLVLSGMVCFA